jgi:hypothetical protein
VDRSKWIPAQKADVADTVLPTPCYRHRATDTVLPTPCYRHRAGNSDARNPCRTQQAIQPTADDNPESALVDCD